MCLPEIWKTVDCYPNYKISNHGRVVNQHGNSLKPYTNGSDKGYLKVKLYNGTHVEQRYVHELVATNFIRPVLNGENCNHLDNNAKNNYIGNLEIVSIKDNQAYKLISKFFGFEGTSPDEQPAVDQSPEPPEQHCPYCSMVFTGDTCEDCHTRRLSPQNEYHRAGGLFS